MRLRSSWNSARLACVSPQRRARSKAGSAVSFTTYGVRASSDPAPERPNIPVV
jgi:hypothetical protein